jgi:hypothetical protein
MLSHDELVTLETARLAAQNVIDGPGRKGGPIRGHLQSELISRARWFLDAMDKVKACHEKQTRSTAS